jgi:hypothetical protein
MDVHFGTVLQPHLDLIVTLFVAHFGSVTVPPPVY